MNKTLFGLALISHNWNHHKKDIFDCYIPLICHTIKDNTHSTITREKLQGDLLKNYGIKISLGACENLLKRMSKNNLLLKNTNEYTVISEKINQSVKYSQRDELNNDFRAFVIEIKKYSKDAFKVDLDTEEIELGLINFFKDNDLDLLFANNDEKSILPSVRESKKAKYIIAKFITDIKTNDPTKFKIALKLAQGYTIASLITYEDIQHFSGNLSTVEVYLDAPIMFSLLGLNGESNLLLAQELLTSLNLNNAKLKIFELNYGEVIKTIQDAIRRLNSGDFDITASSRVLKTAVREGISSQELQMKLNSIESILMNYSIIKVDSPSLLTTEWKYQIDENKLTKTIEELYQGSKDSYKIPWYKANQIERDVTSISNIFKIRKSVQSLSLKSCKALFLTNNEIIAFAAKKHEQSDWTYKSTIPVCVTDIFLSTILWANYPSKNDNLNIKQLMSECYNIIELDNRLLNKFYEDIEKMRKENIITSEQFHLLNSSNLTYSLLEKKTLNDIEEYTDKTPSEILQDIQLRVDAELQKERDQLSKIDQNLTKISRFIATAVFYVIALILLCVFFILRAFNPSLDGTWWNFSMWTIASLIGIFGFLRWMDWIPTKTVLESKIQVLALNKLKNVLNK